MDIAEYLATRNDVTRELLSEGSRATLDKIEAYKLANIRKNRNVTQKQLATKMGVGQSRVSEIEHGDLGSTQLDTIRRYVECLGAKLTLSVEWDDKKIDLA